MKSADMVTYFSNLKEYHLMCTDGTGVVFTKKQMNILSMFVGGINNIDSFYDQHGNEVVQLGRELTPKKGGDV